MTALSVIIPANNEEGYIGPCLARLAVQDLDPAPLGGAEIIVAANACRDATVAEADAARANLEAAGWRLVILDLGDPGKLGAINSAEQVARGRVLAYLDADVLCAPPMMRLLVATLDRPEPRYASGRLVVAPAKSWISRHYARVWAQLPFMATGVQGAGLFAVNRAGRARWDSFPDVIADDGFVRLMFSPGERVMVEADYLWPVVEGFAQLVRVRRRQDAGVREIARRYPALLVNESKPPMTPGDHLKLFARMPLSYLVYVAVILAVRSGGRDAQGWSRGR